MITPYVDIHSHNYHKTSHVKIVSIIIGENISAIENYICVGIHPWHSNIPSVELEPIFAPYLDRIVAIGEIGLDRTIQIPIEKQRKIFEAQLDIARKYHLPVVIHCVKAYSDILATIQRYSGLTYVFHGFYANEKILNALLKYNAYFSMGLRELQRINGTTLIRQIPVNRLFLETDDSNVEIEEVYKVASRATNTDLYKLKEQLHSNYIHL